MKSGENYSICKLASFIVLYEQNLLKNNQQLTEKAVELLITGFEKGLLCMET